MVLRDKVGLRNDRIMFVSIPLFETPIPRIIFLHLLQIDLVNGTDLNPKT